MKNLDIHGHTQSVSQAIFTEMDAVDVARDGHKYNTNAVILVGCKVGFRVWCNISFHLKCYSLDLRDWIKSCQRFRV